MLLRNTIIFCLIKGIFEGYFHVERLKRTVHACGAIKSSYLLSHMADERIARIPRLKGVEMPVSWPMATCA